MQGRSVACFWFCFLLLLPMISSSQTTNTDESRVPVYQLPELQISEAGIRIATKEAWEAKRRPEVLRTIEKEVYGKVPPGEIDVETTEKILDPSAFNGKATLREISFVFKNKEKSNEATLLLILPNSKQPTPVFLGYNFQGNHTILPHEAISLPKGWVLNGPQIGVMDHKASQRSRGSKYSRWPILNILNHGYGVATMHYGDIDPDFDDGFKNGVHALFTDYGPFKPDDWGSIATWSWGLSRILDYFETDDLIDHKKVAVIGHSRLGKAALWAGAKDTRFAMVVSNDSGCGGAALSNRRFGETVSAINHQFPHWFCDNFNKYNDRESLMSFDQHFLLALIAPRPLYVASAKNDSWADPRGEFLAAKNASEVYTLYGLTGLENHDFPSENMPIQEGSLGYHIRTGGHDLTIYDWEQFLNFADHHLK